MPLRLTLIVVLLGLVAAVVYAILRKNSLGAGTGPILVLRRFEIKTDESPAVLIEGRPSGLMSWILTVFGLEALTVFMVTDEQVRVRRASLFGEIHDVVPTAAVSSTRCAYLQPTGLLIFAGVIVVLSLVFALVDRGHAAADILFGLTVGIICAVTYVLQRKIVISIETRGGRPVGVAFKPSLIEGVYVNLPKALAVVARINNIVVARSALHL